MRRFLGGVLLVVGFLTSGALAEEEVQIVWSQPADGPAAHGFTKLAAAISEQNIGTKVLEILNDREARLVPRTDSASSIKIKGNAPSFLRARAWAKRSRTIRSDSPNHIFRISGPLMWRKAPWVTGALSPFAPEASWADSPTSFERLAAAACPIKVLPQPGGP